MLRRVRWLVAPVIAFTLLAANLYVFGVHTAWKASAHSWEDYHWDRSGTYIRIDQWWAGGGTYSQAAAARLDAWYKVPELYNYWVTSHSNNVAVWDAWYADSWGGLASLESLDWDWGCWCYRHISDGHARYNNRYGFSNTWWIQGVHCQEVVHTYGFGHHGVIVDGLGSCMGLGYYPGSSNVLNTHDRWDFYWKYRYH